LHREDQVCRFVDLRLLIGYLRLSAPSTLNASSIRVLFERDLVPQARGPPLLVDELDADLAAKSTFACNLMPIGSQIIK
jgi:hypothetical protein